MSQSIPNKAPKMLAAPGSATSICWGCLSNESRGPLGAAGAPCPAAGPSLASPGLNALLSFLGAAAWYRELLPDIPLPSAALSPPQEGVRVLSKRGGCNQAFGCSAGDGLQSRPEGVTWSNCLGAMYWLRELTRWMPVRRGPEARVFPGSKCEKGAGAGAGSEHCRSQPGSGCTFLWAICPIRAPAVPAPTTCRCSLRGLAWSCSSLSPFPPIPSPQHAGQRLQLLSAELKSLQPPQAEHCLGEGVLSHAFRGHVLPAACPYAACIQGRLGRHVHLHSYACVYHTFV